MNITKKYTNGEVTVVWKPDLCIHSENCFHGLPQVFDPRNKPWVNVQGASTETIVQQIKKCPSGALSYFLDEEKRAGSDQTHAETMVEISPNGPLLVHGNLIVKSPDGSVVKREKLTALCRCGGSGNKPFCDGSHKRINFEG